MKTTMQFLTAALLLLSATTAVAQANFGEFKWGLKAGANFANLSNDGDVSDEKGKTGFTGGAFCKIPLKPYVSIRPELLYTMKGGSYRVQSDVVGQTDKIGFSLHYIEVPLSVDFDLYGMLDLHAGIQGAYMLSNSVKFNDGSEAEIGDFQKGEFGWHAGGGIDLGNIGLHIRFHQSLTSFWDTVLYGAGDVESKNWGISLTAAYMFL